MNELIRRRERAKIATHTQPVIIIIIKKLFKKKKILSITLPMCICVYFGYLHERKFFFHQLNQNSIESNKQTNRNKQKRKIEPRPKGIQCKFLLLLLLLPSKHHQWIPTRRKKNSNGPQGILHREKKMVWKYKKDKILLLLLTIFMDIFFFLLK